MIDWNCRSALPAAWRAVLAALARPLLRLGLSPDHLSIASLGPAFAAALAAAEGAFILAAGLVLASGLCDVLDGAMARAGGCGTRRGALLDSTLDRAADALPLVGLCAALAPHGTAWLPALTMMTGFTVPYARARAEALGARLPALWMRRPERLLLLVVSMALADVTIPQLAIAHPVLVAGLCLLVAGGMAATANTLRHAARSFQKDGRGP